eukprot:GHVL01016389.1.p1 GENE.GHVL01016389.1~~GHVL01016389.1.p1  ORF type:complete len:206 (+),score=82.67 GHVL01016389.1:267-884(+)
MYFNTKKYKINDILSKNNNIIHMCVWLMDMVCLLYIINNNIYDINKYNIYGITPIILCIKLINYSNDYIKILKYLLYLGADPMKKSINGWTAIDEAISYKNKNIIKIIFIYLQNNFKKKIIKQIPRINDALNILPDFYMEIKWEFESSILPIISNFAPSDILKLWKYKNNLRLDTTLVNWKNFKSKRRNMSTLIDMNIYNNKIYI